MTPATAALRYIIQTLFTLYIMAYLLRFLLQLARADFYNPLSQFVVKITNPLLIPTRRVVPGWGGIDWACFLLISVLTFIKMLTLSFVISQTLLPWSMLLLLSVIDLLSAFIDVYFYSIMLEVLFSWISQGQPQPLLHVVRQLNAPLLKPFQRIFPSIGGMDLSPLFAMMGLQLFNILVIGHLQTWSGLIVS